MKLKISITGHNYNIMEDVSDHLKEDCGYIPIKCNPNRDTLLDMAIEQHPRVIIICMGDESEEAIMAYNVLDAAFKHGNCTIIVIANDEDEKNFMKNSTLRKVLFLSRPVSLFALYDKLSEIEEQLVYENDENQSAFREYESENTFKRKHILVVDDDAEQLLLIKEQLEEFYDVTMVKSGQQAIKFLAKKIPDLILLDYLMPDEDGPSFLTRMREIENFANIPVVFLTGMTEKGTILHTLVELKPQGYVIKPVKKSELVAKIIEVLG